MTQERMWQRWQLRDPNDLVLTNYMYRVTKQLVQNVWHSISIGVVAVLAFRACKLEVLVQ